MLKELSPKRKFALMLVAVYAVSLPIVSGGAYVILKRNAVRDAYNMGRVHLSTIGAIKYYVAHDLRPVLYEEIPGRFILQGMSRSYVAGEIARRIHREDPDYVYKNASLNPRNPQDAADDFEVKIINTFIKDRKLREWKGFRTRQDGEYYVIARPGEPFEESCLYCHGDPADAPPELIKRYGSTAGFGMKVGQLADARFIYIPISVPLASARKAVAVFIGFYTLFFAVILFIINMRFRGLYSRIDSDKRKIDSINTDLSELNQQLEALVAERTMSLMALTVADKVRNPATVIAWTCKRLLEKERVPEKFGEDIQDVIGESGKLEAIVRDFELLSKSRQSVFSFEDINTVVKAIAPLVEKEAAEKGLHLAMNLPERPLKINLQKNLLRVAILHVIRNAIDATPEGGTITVTTSGDKDSVMLAVSDTGAGIPKADVEKIFDPFFSTKRLRYGLGLPMVKQIVSEHFGEIEVQSEPGKGTTLRMVFPVRWMERPAA
ncbi:MAG: DUF3365 domain-containing protein [Nitrospirota bacterium]